ncbi:MarR family winged helix-turn-helix transcriptional regulator [Arthrobacter sp. GMC3]|uniref:MarR family winged helix-turn-helix transcriptional regulator n=1 Tax=Arthrobacter sp. GMC3 TaxID=2058894 RepID=UPI000CE3D0AC|nr:MarR family transcriptional regulator [Arthrobacter sp. GMC3]
MTQISAENTTTKPAPAAAQGTLGEAKRQPRGVGAGVLAAELRVAVMRTSRRLRAEGASREISPGQYSVLVGVLNGPLTSGQLADREQIQAPSMTRIVNGLAAAGFVTREANPQDRRQVLVQITAAGTEALQRARTRRTEWLAKRVSALTTEQRATLHQAALILTEMSSS